MMARIGKAIAALIALIVIVLVILVNFGAAETRLVCPGEVKPAQGAGATTAATLYARVESYRWFIVWANHDHMIFWEVRPGNHTGFGYYDNSSFATNITELTGTKPVGSFSSLSQHIYVETASDGTQAFEGLCKPA